VIIGNIAEHRQLAFITSFVTVVEDMRLTDKELEIMAVLWDSKTPMTASEIVEASDNRTWKESSIYIIMKTLIKKGVAVLTHHKSTNTNSARAYKPALSSAECTALYISSVAESGIHIDIDELIKCLKEKKG
jgi:predicted transcriptional regulator